MKEKKPRQMITLGNNIITRNVKKNYIRKRIWLCVCIAFCFLISGCNSNSVTEEKTENKSENKSFDITKLNLGFTQEEINDEVGVSVEQKADIFGDYSYQADVRFEEQYCTLYVDFDENDKAEKYELDFTSKSDACWNLCKESLTKIFSVEPVEVFPIMIDYDICYLWDVSSLKNIKYNTVYLCRGKYDLDIVIRDKMGEDIIISEKKEKPSIDEKDAQNFLEQFLDSSEGIRQFKKEMEYRFKRINKISDCEIVTISRNPEKDEYELSREAHGYLYQYGFIIKGNLQYMDEYGKKGREYFECPVSVDENKEVYFQTILAEFK